MKSSHAVLTVAVLFAAAALLAPASSAAAYHSITWDKVYEYEGVEISTNAADNTRIPHGDTLEITIRSDRYDVSLMDIHVKNSESDTVRIYDFDVESGFYRLEVTDDLVLVLKNFVELPAGATEPQDDPADDPVVEPPLEDPPQQNPEDQQEPPQQEAEDQQASEPYTPKTASGQGLDGESFTGLLLGASACAAVAVLIYGLFAVASGGVYYGKP